MFTGLANIGGPQWAWRFALALLIVLASMLVFTPIIHWVRERRFAIQASKEPGLVTDREVIAKGFGIPEVSGSPSLGAALDALSRPMSQVHTAANRLQRIYHNRVAGAVICLTVALVALGLSLTVLHHDADAKAVTAAIDIFALLIAFYQWWASHSANHRWVATRTRAELLRQWTFLTALLSPVREGGSAEELFRERDRVIEDQVVQARMWVWWRRVRAIFQRAALPVRSIEDRISDYWQSYRSECEVLAEGRTLSPDNQALYLRRRPVRQLAWVRLTLARLLVHHKSRLRWLAFLYGLSLILAGLKAALAYKEYLGASLTSLLDALPHSSADMISLALLLTTVLSAAVTGLYLSRNDRSLFHRYATQERFIDDWLRGWQDHAAKPTEAQIKYLLGFENLMVEELVDWVHVTAHDTLELSP